MQMSRTTRITRSGSAKPTANKNEYNHANNSENWIMPLFNPAEAAAAQRKILSMIKNNSQNIVKQNAFPELTMRCYTTDFRPLVE